MAKSFCSKCKKALGGFFGDTVCSYEGKDYCYDCWKAIPKPKNYGMECRNCAYCADAGFEDDAICTRHYNKRIDRYKQACEDFEKFSR